MPADIAALYVWYMTHRTIPDMPEADPATARLQNWFHAEGQGLERCLISTPNAAPQHGEQLGYDISSGPDGLSLLGWGLNPRHIENERAYQFFEEFRPQLNEYVLFDSSETAQRCLQEADLLQRQGLFMFEGASVSESFQVYSIALLPTL